MGWVKSIFKYKLIFRDDPQALYELPRHDFAVNWMCSCGTTVFTASRGINVCTQNVNFPDKTLHSYKPHEHRLARVFHGSTSTLRACDANSRNVVAYRNVYVVYLH